MKKVFKYPLPVSDLVDLRLPKGAKILTVQTQKGIPCIWALVDPEEGQTEKRSFRLAGTGHPIEGPDYFYEYIGTFQLSGGALVFHLFELVA